MYVLGLPKTEFRNCLNYTFCLFFHNLHLMYYEQYAVPLFFIFFMFYLFYYYYYFVAFQIYSHESNTH